jgi:hypothetical protein
MHDYLKNSYNPTRRSVTFPCSPGNSRSGMWWVPGLPPSRWGWWPRWEDLGRQVLGSGISCHFPEIPLGNCVVWRWEWTWWWELINSTPHGSGVPPDVGPPAVQDFFCLSSMPQNTEVFVIARVSGLIHTTLATGHPPFIWSKTLCAWNFLMMPRTKLSLPYPRQGFPWGLPDF